MMKPSMLLRLLALPWAAMVLGVAMAMVLPATARAQFPPVGPGGARPPVGPGMGQPPGLPGQDWWARTPVFRSKFYNIKTDLEPDDAKIMAEHMDATFAAYWALFSRLPVRLQRPATLDLYLFANEQDYMNVLALRFKDNGAGSWGKCITSGKSISLVGWKGHHSLEEVKRLLQHEGFHQVSSHLFTGTPLWAEEGMAELFERGVAVGDQLAVGEFSPRDKAVLMRALEQGGLMPLERFLAVGSEEWSARVQTGAAELQYLQAWSLVHFLVFAENGKYETQYLNFLVQLNRRVPWRQAFVASFGVPDFKAMETQYREYLAEVPPSDYRETLDRLEFLAAGMEALREEEIYPTSIDELKAGLQEIGFEHDSELPGEPRRMSAQDVRLFEVPLAKGVPERKFAIVEPRTSGTAGRSRLVPPPASIVAEGLYPQVFLAEWDRRARPPAYVLSATPSAKYKARPAPAAPAARPDSNPEPSETDPSDGSRTWTSADGKFTTEAELVGYADETAQLRRADGAVIRVRREQLCPADREYLDRWAREAP